MEQGQEKFLSFILERIKEDKIDEAKALLADNFKKQAEGNFTQDDIAKTIPKMLALLKPEKVEEVQAIMKQFAQDFQR
jgi:hypothetical protein